MTPTYDATNVEVTVGGERVDATEISYTQNATPEIEDTYASPEHLATYQAEFTMLLKGGWKAWAEMLATPLRCGASLATLQRRTTYGGRKGRRAIRRLLAEGWYTFAPKPRVWVRR